MDTTSMIVLGGLIGLVVWGFILQSIIAEGSKSKKIEKHLSDINEKLSKLIDSKNQNSDQ